MKYLNLILILTGLAFAAVTRIVIPFGRVFTDYGIILNTPDAYCMVRYADTMPYYQVWDYFSGFPKGIASLSQVVFPGILNALSCVFNTSSTMVAAILPVILFFLTVFAVYQIGQALFAGRAGAISVFIFCLLPGEILNRTMLGAGDYHCWELFLVTNIMMLIILAIKEREDQLYQITLAVFALVLMIVYWFSWQGAPLVPFILIITIGIYLFFRLCSNNLERTIFIIVAVTLGLVLYIWSLPYQPSPGIFVIDLSQNITEDYPLFFTAGQFDLNTMMAYFGVTFYIVLFGIGWLLWRVIRHRRIEDILFLSWTVIILAMMIARRRFDYYFAVNAAIIIAYVIVRLLGIITKSNLARLAIVAVAIISLPLAKTSIVSASLDYSSPSRSWINTCQWLQGQNTDNNETAYYKGEKPSYGVFSWWNYGYWLMAIGHQAVWSNNGTVDYNGNSAILLSADDNASLARLQKSGIRYIVISADMFRSASLQSNWPHDTFMYHAYTGQVTGLRLVHQAEDIKTFEIKKEL